MQRFESMSNELILCAWDQLSSADVIYSFSHLNTRIDSLLLEFHALYKELDLRYCSLSACRFFYHQVPNVIEWRFNLTVLKLGRRYRCSQMKLFADEVAKSCDNISKDIQPIFPQLVSFVVFQTTSISEESRDILLYGVVGGSVMRTFTWHASANQTRHSTAFFDWLFRCSVNLVSYQLQTPSCENGFVLTYEHTIIHFYTPHRSLVYLKINILYLNTLYVLLHYLPQLEHFGKQQEFI